METKRPGALTAIAIIAIVLGSLGGCMGMFGLAGAAMSGSMQEMQREMLEGVGSSPEIEAQRRMQDEMAAINSKWLPFTASHQALNLLASTLLLAAGVLMLRGSPRAAVVFLAAAGVNLFVDLAGGGLGILVQQDTQEAMQSFMSTAAATQPGGPDMARMFDGIMQASGWASACFAVGWLLVKAGFYGWGAIYVRKPAARAYLTAAAR